MERIQQIRTYTKAVEGTDLWEWLDKQFHDAPPGNDLSNEDWLMERIKADPVYEEPASQQPTEDEYDPTMWEAQPPFEMQVDAVENGHSNGDNSPLPAQPPFNLVEPSPSHASTQLPTTHIAPSLLYQSSSTSEGNGTIQPSSLTKLEITPTSSRQTSPAENSPAPPSPPSDPVEIDTQKLRSLLAPISMIKAPATSSTNLFKFLLPIASHLPAKLRQEVINAIVNSAETRYYAALLKSDTVLTVLEAWLKDLVGKQADEFKGTGFGLIEIVKKLPVTGETILQLNRIPRYVRKISEKAANEKVKDAAKSLLDHYEKMLDEHDTKKPSASAKAPAAAEASSNKKRKVESNATSSSKSSTSSKPTSSTSKSSTSSSSSKLTTSKSTASKPSSSSTASKAKSAATSSSTAPKVSTDSSWFQKPQAPLPTIKKKTPAGTAAAPSKPPLPVDAFTLAMQHLSQPKAPAPAPSKAEPKEGPTVLGKRGIGEVEGAAGPAGEGKKKKKSVVWKDSIVVDGKPGELNAIREFTQADHEIIRNNEHLDLSQSSHDEGDSLKQGLIFQEDIDWYEPEPIQLPDDMLSPEFPSVVYVGEEAASQLAREAQVLAAMYMSEHEVPETPFENEVSLVEDGPTTQRFLVSRAFRGPEPGEEPTPEPEADVGSLLALLGQVPGLGAMDAAGQQQQQQQHQQQFQQQQQPAYNPHFDPHHQQQQQQFYPPGPSQQQYPPQPLYNAPPPSYPPHDPYAARNLYGQPPPPVQQSYPDYVPPAQPSWYDNDDREESGRRGGRGGARGGSRGRGARGGVHPGSVRTKAVPCNFYRTPRGCLKGDDCPFMH